MRPPVRSITPPSLHQTVVVMGGGFAGLTLIQHLRIAAVNIVLIDRCNHHVFQPLRTRWPPRRSRPTKRDFRNIDPTTARIVLLEAGPHLLPGFQPKVRVYAEKSLQRLRVEVRLNTPVEMIDADGVAARGERIDASVVIWCAGVKATPIAACLGASTTRKGAIRVAPDLSVPGISNIFAIGDVAALDEKAGKPLPLLA